MKELKMVQANIGIEGYSERLRKMVRKPISKENLISRLTEVQRYIPILSLNFISHLPSVNVDDVLEFKETMEAVLFQRDKEGLNTGYDFTITPFIARPHTPMGLCPYREEKAEQLAKEARTSLWEQFTSTKMKFEMSVARRKMEFLLSRGDESFSELFIKTYSKYPTYYFHQTFATRCHRYAGLPRKDIQLLCRQFGCFLLVIKRGVIPTRVRSHAPGGKPSARRSTSTLASHQLLNSPSTKESVVSSAEGGDLPRSSTHYHGRTT